MDCPWKRTLASVFLLLSPHHVRVLSQNVGPTGPLPPLPLLREPLRDCSGLNPGAVPKQMNLISGPPNGILPEFVPFGLYSPEYQRIPEYIGPTYPQALPFNPVPNLEPFPQGPAFNIPQNLPPLQGPILNVPPNINVPPLQAPYINIAPTPQVPIPLSPIFNSPQITNISPQGSSSSILPITVAPISQGPTCNIPTGNLPLPQGLQPNISPVQLVSNAQGQILPGPQVPISPITGSAWNVPTIAGFQNQNMQMFPLLSNPYSQSYLPSANGPSTLTTDLTSVHFLPPPNLPSSIPTQNYAFIPSTPIQPVVYPQSITPIDCLSNTPVFDFQISGLPPVFPENIPQLYDNPRVNSQPVGEEYSPVPINLQINVPSPTMPEPKITIITAFPSAPTSPVPTTTTDSSDVSYGMYPPYPLPPIIIEGRRSSSRSWLPLILVALITRDGYYGGNCGGSCCCCCPCNSSADIPIPYPIAIPTNNPVILGSSCRKRRPKAKETEKKKD